MSSYLSAVDELSASIEKKVAPAVAWPPPMIVKTAENHIHLMEKVPGKKPETLVKPSSILKNICYLQTPSSQKLVIMRPKIDRMTTGLRPYRSDNIP